MASRFEASGQSRYRVSGPMTFTTVTGLLRESARHFSAGEHAEVDLSQVGESDSAGLALLIEWKRIARQKNGSVTFTNVPPQVTALARISEVDELLSESSPLQPEPTLTA